MVGSIIVMLVSDDDHLYAVGQQQSSRTLGRWLGVDTSRK